MISNEEKLVLSVVIVFSSFASSLLALSKDYLVLGRFSWIYKHICALPSYSLLLILLLHVVISYSRELSLRFEDTDSKLSLLGITGECPSEDPLALLFLI